MTDNLRVLTIGAGYFARLHIDAWLRNPRTDLVGVCDTNPDIASQFEDIATFGTDAAQMITALRPDIVDIATPPTTHRGLIDTALAAGVETVICQKPFCGDYETAGTVIREIGNNRVFVHENFRFQPWYRHIQAMLASDEVGQVFGATFRFRPGDGQGPRAYLERQPYFQKMNRFLIHETGIHWIDTFRYLFGDVSSVFADLRRLNLVISGEDAGILMLEHVTGAQSVFDGNRLADHATEDTRLTMGEMRIDCANGEITLDGKGKVYWRDRGAHQPELKFTAKSGSFGGDCVFHFQNHIVSHLLNGTPVENTAREYLRNMEIAEAAYRSATSGQKLLV